MPLTERSATDPPMYPDTIFLFQEPLEEMCATHEESVEEIEITDLKAWISSTPIRISATVR